MKKTKKPFLIITGMHRSGTSFLSRALNLRGIYLGKPNELISDDWNPIPENPRGHWENKEFFELTEKTLAVNGGSWYKIPEKIEISDQLGKKIQQNISELVNYQYLGTGIKDPRLIFCLESWIEYLPEKFYVIAIFRNPLKVAESLKKRNGFNYKESIKLWTIYNQKLLLLLQKHQGFLLNFDWPKEKLFSEIDMISEQLGLSKKVSIADWYSEELKQSDKTYDEKFQLGSETLSMLSKLEEQTKKNTTKEKITLAYENNDLLNSIDNLLLQIKEQGNYFKNINDTNLKKIQNNLIKISNLESSLKEKDQQISNLQNSIKEKEQQISNLQNSIKEKDQQISNLQNSIKEKDQQISNLQNSIKEKDQQISNLQNSIKEKDQQISNLQNSIKEKDQQISQLQTSNNDLQKTIYAIQNTITWKFLTKIYSIRKKIGSKNG